MIGRHSSEIIQTMKNQDTGFRYNREVSTDKIHYLKYVDGIQSKTLIYVLNDDGFCSSYVIVYDNAYYSDVTKKINTLYKPSGSNEWIDEIEGKKFAISLRQNKWYFSVTTKRIVE